MTLTFPNGSRSYDALRNRIRFLGYDGMFEIPFFLEVDALPNAAARSAGSEADILHAFDMARLLVHKVALKAYGRPRKNMYILTAANFR